MIRTNTINVIYGIHDLEMSLAGLTVEEIQISLRDVLGVRMDAEAYLGGNLIVEKTITVVAGERIEFVKPFGKKGVGQTWTKEEFMQVFRMTEADWLNWVAKGLPFDTMQDGTMVLNETEVDRWKAAQQDHKTQPRRSAVLRRNTTASNNRMLHLQEAADIIGYSQSGLRKLVRHNMIRYFQRGPHSPILFDPEWLREFQARGTKDTAWEQSGFGSGLKQRKKAKRAGPVLPPPGDHGFNWWKS
jgi:hypothetical protein